LRINVQELNANSPAVDKAWGRRDIDGLALAALAYLALPLFIFLLGWFEWGAALVLTAAAAAGMRGAFLSQASPLWSLRLQGRHLAILALALLWTSLGGAGHFAYANFDWIIRDAVLHDLTLHEWPPAYRQEGDFALILRCPIAYYLPAAVVGKLLGLASADFLLWLWTWLGVSLTLLLLPLPTRSGLRLLLGLLVVVLFSGMDYAGWTMLYPATVFKPPEPTDHLEWWARVFQYSSHSTQLFWVPNHTLPAWIGAALFMRHWRAPAFLGIAPMLLACLPLWSPFALLGMTPFMAMPLYCALRERQWQALRLAYWPPVGLVLAVVLLYLTLDMNRISGGAALAAEMPNFALHLLDYAIFIVFEVAILAFVLWRLEPSPPLLMAIAILLLLPLRRFGPGNDLVMRASIPALLVLCAAVLRVIERGVERRQWVDALVLSAVLGLGAVTPWHEILRAVSLPPWPPSLAHNLLDTQNQHSAPAHYTARLNQALLTALLRKPDWVEAPPP
jgi:hypothetical protein